MSGLNGPEMFLSGGIRAPATSKASYYVVYFVVWFTQGNWSGNHIDNFANSLARSGVSVGTCAAGARTSNGTFTAFSWNLAMVSSVFIVIAV